MTTSLAARLARWALDLEPTVDDLALAERSLLDTVAVTIAARDHHVALLTRGESDVLRFAAVGHVLDFDDLHMESTAHVSVVCVPAVLATGGDARAYLAAAGVMGRVGMLLGWSHYDAGWHITCTAGAVGAAVGAGIALGLDEQQLITAIALAVPASGGVQRAFGTDGKSLQVGFAADAGVRAARLASRGATADGYALDDWLTLLGADPGTDVLAGPAVPGGLAIKIYPACYALQRPIHCIQELRTRLDLSPADVERIDITTPQATVKPLIHSRPTTGLQGKFSLEYAAATALLDDYSGFAAFDDQAVQRDEAQRLLHQVDVHLTPGGDWLLDGQVGVAITTTDGRRLQATEEFPPGSPQRPPTPQEFAAKLDDCLAGSGVAASDVTWTTAPTLLRRLLG